LVAISGKHGIDSVRVKGLVIRATGG